MSTVINDVTGRVFGRLILQNALVWAATMLGAAVTAKASNEFFWVLLVLVAGSSLSAAAIESARRRSLPNAGSSRGLSH